VLQAHHTVTRQNLLPSRRRMAQRLVVSSRPSPGTVSMCDAGFLHCARPTRWRAWASSCRLWMWTTFLHWSGGCPCQLARDLTRREAST
jgi:hypothetical protein